jgi:hypothetical protein
VLVVLALLFGVEIGMLSGLCFGNRVYAYRLRRAVHSSQETRRKRSVIA